MRCCAPQRCRAAGWPHLRGPPLPAAPTKRRGKAEACHAARKDEHRTARMWPRYLGPQSPRARQPLAVAQMLRAAWALGPQRGVGSLPDPLVAVRSPAVATGGSPPALRARPRRCTRWRRAALVPRPLHTWHAPRRAAPAAAQRCPGCGMRRHGAAAPQWPHDTRSSPPPTDQATIAAASRADSARARHRVLGARPARVLPRPRPRARR